MSRGRKKNVILLCRDQLNIKKHETTACSWFYSSHMYFIFKKCGWPIFSNLQWILIYL